jgi:hypothetical protein
MTTMRSGDTMRTTSRATGWVGWIWFAALIMIMNGGFNVIDGLVALFKDKVYVQGSAGLVVFDFTTWGWILLTIGVVQLLVGFALMYGAMWARISAIGLVVLSSLSQIAFITAYPFWSLTVIFLDILVLWAVVVHGNELEQAEI